MPNTRSVFQPGIPGSTYADLFQPESLARLTAEFFSGVEANDPAVFRKFEEYRKCGGEGLSAPDISDRIVAMAPHLGSFLARLFGVERECAGLRDAADRERILLGFKRDFVLRRALKKVSREEALTVDLIPLEASLAVLRTHLAGETADGELATARAVRRLSELDLSLRAGRTPALRSECADLHLKLVSSGAFEDLPAIGGNDEALLSFVVELLTRVERWLAGHYHQSTELALSWISFRIPRPVDFGHLVELRPDNEHVPPAQVGPEEEYRHRQGFDLTDPRYSRREVMNEVDYCIFCHEREKDTCSHGFRKEGGFATNPLGYPMGGCPLDQKISESHVLMDRGDVIGALAIIAIDNPMAPGTGHRICNDCMKACIFQKQEPVNIPQIETGILTDVLKLPWGFEIYSLLTRWNPLNIHRPHALPFNGKKILVVGMGPAGYTLAHYFLNEGFGVVGVDALKIEPLPPELAGGPEQPFEPVRDYSDIERSLSERILLGFGGVSEYGITVRWDKNFLTIIYLNLLRRAYFRIYDGVRFGGTLTVEDAWELGFDHVCLATGAGKPTFVSIRNNLIRGIRKASDFLMALQLTGAGKKESLANLQVRLPAVVIGGGLTAIDTATELMAYYPVQVVKIRDRFERLCGRYGEQDVRAMFTEEELAVLGEFLEHAGEIERERTGAASEGREPDFIPLLRKWGGVHVYYRKSINDSPAYRLNHEEIIKGLEEGIGFVEQMSPVEAVPDPGGALSEVVFAGMAKVDGRWKETGALIRVPARSMFVAAGTSPNVMYEREHPGTFDLDERDEFFESYIVRGEGGGSMALEKAPENEVGFFTSYGSNGKFVSYYGDNHPVFEGNVVKAMASAKHGFRKVIGLFGDIAGAASVEDANRWKELIAILDDRLKATVVRVERLAPSIVEVIVRAPMAAGRFQPGQFYRLQNYEVDAPSTGDSLLTMEGLALTGAWVDREKGYLSLIVLEVGASSRMCAMLKPGQRVVVMGPTGAPTETPENSTVLLLGGGLGNAVLFSIAKALKEKNSKVIYFAGYKKAADLFKRGEIESSTDVVVYSVDGGDPIETRRPQDRTFAGNIVEAMIAYASGALGDVPIPLKDAVRVIAIGSDRMMAAVASARHSVLQPYLNDCHVGIASINSPMQCMMKAVCAQCVQRHVIPGTNEEVFVFTCFNQDQEMDRVDFANLNSRLRANSLSEKIMNRWLDFVLEEYPLHRV
jgi:NADPH-dependent glutamate synthase beta subunit-like oxidoreductase/NAD(P)H-flavin reductase